MKNKIIVQADVEKSKISRHIYGHFSEHLGRGIYEGLWVGEDSDIPNTNGIRNDVLEALRNIKVPVLRWPGGCFADEYHWKDGVGPREKRKKMINTHWGGVVEDNSFGTHEFMMLCEMLECEPYICGNVGSGTVQEMSEWVEYITFDGESPMANWRRENGREDPWRLKYFGVGNESWGCGGHMRPEYYADLYRRYQTFVRNYGENRIYKIAGGASDFDYNWTEVVMKNAHSLMDGLSLHYYTVPGHFVKGKGSATDFTEKEWYVTLKKALTMDELITKHGAIMDKYDPEKRVGLIIDEWGTWYDPEPGTNPGFLYQQNTIRDALVAAIHFNIFHKHSDRVHMANIAQMVNVLQAVIHTKKEKMFKTPTYHVFDMFKVNQDATLLDTTAQVEQIEIEDVSIPGITVSASKDHEENIHINIASLHLDDHAETMIDVRGLVLDNYKITGTILTAKEMNAHNTFDNPENVKPAAYNSYQIADGKLYLNIPPKSVLVISLLKNKN